MPTDTMTLIGLGVGAVVILWLVFSVLKKVFGLVVLVALALGGFILWNDPEMVRSLTDMVAGFFGSR